MTAATTTQPTVTDARFNALKAKLRELFELDKSDLDFGIYRIMAAKNEEVTRFLDTQLRKIVTDTLGQFGEIENHNVQHELDQTIQTLKDNQVPDEQIENNPKVKDLRQQLKTSGGTSGAGLEADIYSHLFAFFARYYDEGDFISQRRYKGDTYAIPYGGEEVVLHWANKDQYYIKSGEHHRDYAFKLPKNRRVQFKVVAATADPNNVKEDAKAKRRHILAPENPIEIEGNTLTLRFEYRAPTEAEKDRAGDNKVAIFGGKYAKSTKGDEREQFCADAEVLALEQVPDDWLAALTAKDATDAKPERTVLGHHLDRYTARNTFDYFIHKDLGGFLSRELDFYLKNEVLRLDDIANLPADHLAKVQGKIKAIRAVAKPLIDFIASLEDFQRSLWLKKKLVLNTHWLVTIDRVPDKLRNTVANNSKQWEEWEALGLKPTSKSKDVKYKWGTRDYLDSCPSLALDTSLFEIDFTTELIASIDNIDDATTGTLVHGENYQGLNLLQAKYKDSVRCVYIDPPYNTRSSAILYKNTYRHSSWWTMLHNRLPLIQPLMDSSGVFFGSIDKHERFGFQNALEDAFGSSNYIEELVWAMNTNNSQAPAYSTNHEYVEVFAKNKDQVEGDRKVFREPKPGYDEVVDLIEELNPTFPSISTIEDKLRALYSRQKKSYKAEVLKSGLDWDEEKNNDPWKGIYNYNRAEYRDLKHNIISPEEAGEANARIWVWRESDASMPATKQASSTRDSSDPNYRFYKPAHPVTGKQCPHPKSGWKFPYAASSKKGGHTFKSLESAKRIVWGEDESKVPQLKRMLWDVELNVSKSVFQDYSDGEKQTSAMFGKSGVFLSPKHSHFVKRFLIQTTEPTSLILDCFGGSGSTAQAVIEINRDEEISMGRIGNRKFLLIEMGEHFKSVLKPRVCKTIYSSKWAEGRAQVFDDGISSLIKCFALENYEDVLCNLPFTTDAAGATNPLAFDQLAEAGALRYALDLQHGPDLLNLDAFIDPWGYTIQAQNAAGETTTRPVDMVETFNYLLGLKVISYGRIRRFSAEFEKAKHDEGVGKLKVKGEMRTDPDGPFAFQRIEGELLNGTRVLVVWRKLTKDAEQDAAALDWWMQHRGEITTQRPAAAGDPEGVDTRPFQEIYLNGPVTLAQWVEKQEEVARPTVKRLEEKFKHAMFRDAEEAKAAGEQARG